MKASLFSQSLFAFDLSEAIAATTRISFPAIELACTSPHFDLRTARNEPEPPLWSAVHHNQISPDVTGYSIWRRAEVILDDPKSGRYAASWSARRDGFPDQYQLDHIIEVDASVVGSDQGYSGWIELDDGRIFVVNYTDDTAPMVALLPDHVWPLLGIPWIRGTYLLPQDLPLPDR